MPIKLFLLDLPTPERATALSDVNVERDRQDTKWGPQNHSPQKWVSILGEEFGEACQEANDMLTPNRGETRGISVTRNFRAELVQVAAVAVAAIECIDRGGLQP